MKIYLVGGAVRDDILGLPVHERDWVVVGGTVDEMLAQGYKPVGKDFPVFLHPETHEEYALARTERKTGKGYKGFTFHTDPSVTLEADLMRRDLTINAMARDDDGTMTDPYGGMADCKDHVLRHVSEAFQEDPVRLLRVARFAAKLPGFTVHPDTLALMRKMVDCGEVDALVAERVWQECEKALQEKAPARFFDMVHSTGADRVLWPGFAWSDLTAHDTQALTEVVDNPPQRLAALLSRFERDAIQHFIDRYRVPRTYAELLTLTHTHYADYLNLLQLDASALWMFFKTSDAMRRPERFQAFLAAARARSLDTHHADGVEALCKQCLQALNAVDIQDLIQENLPGPEMANALKSRQVQAIYQLLDDV